MRHLLDKYQRVCYTSDRQRGALARGVAIHRGGTRPWVLLVVQSRYVKEIAQWRTDFLGV
jgi:hypothetical protein